MKEIVRVTFSGSEVADLKSIGSVDESRLEALDKAKASIYEFNKNHQLIDYVVENYNDFMKMIADEVNSALSRKHLLEQIDYDYVMRSSQRTILNLLMSIRTFTEHLETRVARDCGKGSVEFRLLKKLLAEEFDTCFAYAFQYKLRNYVQHCGMPPLTVNSKLDQTDDGLNVVLTLSLNRDKLLDSYDSWGGIVKPQLKAQSDELDIFALLEEVMQSVIRAYVRFLIKTDYGEVKKAKATILEIIGEDASYALEEYAVADFIEIKERGLKLNLHWIPTSIFPKLDQIEEWMASDWIVLD